ncbi:mucin-3A-like [Passer domesticus]|uniref:mucin-3A-like n=1 Tax=Passer domesticus TaxID=48849 RepID=UPI0030FE2E76
MTTKIEGKFDDNLKNTSSDAFRDFNKTFQEQMQKLYKDIEGYKGVVIKNLSSGSIQVDYDVKLEIPATSEANKTVKTISENLVAAIQNYNCSENCTGSDCVCFVSNFTSVVDLNMTQVEENLCDRQTQIKEEFRRYYMPFLTSTGVICITRCDSRHTDSLPCVYGRCSVSQAGPQCECSDKVAFWYWDKACSSRISKVGVGVGVPVAILVLVTTTFTILLLRSRRQKEQYRKKLRSRSELYSSDDGNWDGSRGFAMGNPAATWEDMETSNISYINLERVDTSRTMHIQRPTMVP